MSPTAVADPRTRGLRDLAEIDADEQARGEIPSASKEFGDRALCVDGTCVGVIGDDGRCKECGAASDSPPSPTPATEGAAAVSGPDPEIKAADSDDDWDQRELCPDGNCVGLLAANGRCGTCGQQAENK